VSEEEGVVTAVSPWALFWWAVLPEVCLAVFLVGHVYRYATDRYGWGSQSSEILEKRILRWASPLFHYGALLVFLGHVAGIMVPLRVYHALGVPDRVYHWTAMGVGGVSGSMMVVGLAGLLWRRLAVPRVRAVTRPSDWLALVMLLVVSLLGLALAVGRNLLAGPYDYRVTIAPWFRGLLLLQPDPRLMAGVPLLFQVHVAASFVLLAVWPFTRLVHVWSLPLAYLRRATILYRARGPAAAGIPGGRRP
jgi:nitrate reductase gamma subunit